MKGFSPNLIIYNRLWPFISYFIVCLPRQRVEEILTFFSRLALIDIVVNAPREERQHSLRVQIFAFSLDEPFGERADYESIFLVKLAESSTELLTLAQCA